MQQLVDQCVNSVVLEQYSRFDVYAGILVEAITDTRIVMRKTETAGTCDGEMLVKD